MLFVRILFKMSNYCVESFNDILLPVCLKVNFFE